MLVWLALGSNIAPVAAAPTDAPTDGGTGASPLATLPRAESVYYMNKTSSAPSIDTVWDSAAWQRGRVYDLSNGQGKCLMYIMFTESPGVSTRIFIGIDVVADADPSANGMLEIAIDGDNDGKVSYENTDPDGTDTGVIWPRTMNGPCVDRWAQLRDGGPNEAGWMNLWCGTVQLWRTTPVGESNDGMGVGFAGHRFYEYSTDYARNLGLNAGSTFGINLRVTDPGGVYFVPGNYSGVAGPFAQFMIAQAPVAGIRAPAANGYYFKGDSIEFDGSGTTDDELAGVSYEWTFDDGGGASGRIVSRNFTTTGRHWATLEATDSDGLKGSSTVYINIKEKNLSPVVTSLIPAPDPVVNETESLVFEVRLKDVNFDQDVGETVWVNWTLDGKIVKTGRDYPASSYTFRTNHDGQYSAGQYHVNVSVQDTYDGGSPEPTLLSWRVTVVNLNRPPLITLADPDVDQLSLAENTEVQLSVEYIDPDGENVTAQWYADSEALPGTRNKSSITWKADYNSSGTHEVKIALTDRSGGLTERAWTVLVSNVDRAPEIISAAPSQEEVGVKEGSDIRFTIVAVDPDLEELSIQWYKTYEGPQSSEGSPYNIKVVARDSFGLAADHSWILSVEESNRPPVAVIDDPTNEESFLLGGTVRVRGDQSWDPDTADNGSLQYLWDFGDGKTGTGPSGNHRYEKPGPYTIRLTVRDRFSASSTFVNINIRAPVLWVTDILVSPTSNIREDRQVNVTVRVSNTGDADARGIQIRFQVDGRHVATLSLAELASGEKDQVAHTWVAVRGEHTLGASIESSPSFILPDGSSSQRTITVKARPAPAARGPPLWLLGAAGAAVVAVVLGAIAWVTVSRRRKARPRPSRTADGRLSPEAALSALTRPAGPMVPLEAAATAAGPVADAGQPATEAAAPGEPPAPPAAPSEAPAEAYAALKETAAVAPAEATSGTAPLAAPTEAAPSEPAAPAAPVCPSCSEPLEPGWGLCPACGTKMEAPAQPAPAAPAAPEMDAAAAAAAAEFSDAVAAIRKRIEVLTAMDKDVSALQSTLDLAASFQRTGKTDKAQKYLAKAQELLAEKDSG